jgi:hypothetical protein
MDLGATGSPDREPMATSNPGTCGLQFFDNDIHVGIIGHSDGRQTTAFNMYIDFAIGVDTQKGYDTLVVLVAGNNVGKTRIFDL